MNDILYRTAYGNNWFTARHAVTFLRRMVGTKPLAAVVCVTFPLIKRSTALRLSYITVYNFLLDFKYTKKTSLFCFYPRLDFKSLCINGVSWTDVVYLRGRIYARTETRS